MKVCRTLEAQAWDLRNVLFYKFYYPNQTTRSRWRFYLLMGGNAKICGNFLQSTPGVLCAFVSGKGLPSAL